MAHSGRGAGHVAVALIESTGQRKTLGGEPDVASTVPVSSELC